MTTNSAYIRWDTLPVEGNALKRQYEMHPLGKFFLIFNAVDDGIQGGETSFVKKKNKYT